MGAFGSCLGVGRPVRPGANPRLLASNLVNADAGALRNGPMRPNSYARDISSISVRSPMQNGFRGPSNTNQHQHIGFNHHSPPSMIVPNLIEIEDNVSMQPSSHLICNRKQFYDEATDPVTKLNQDIRLNPAERRIFIALYDYESKNDDDLAFVKGEQLETTTKYMTDNGWWLARSWPVYAMLVGSLMFLILVEVLNTAVEATCNAVTREFDRDIQLAKDCGSLAVLIAILMTATVWVSVLAQRLAT